jgi:hypothetical protein
MKRYQEKTRDEDIWNVKGRRYNYIQLLLSKGWVHNLRFNKTQDKIEEHSLSS